MDGLYIHQIASANDPADPKGNVWNWNQNNRFAVTVLERKAGVKFGGHYHIGTDPSKNPERIFIAKGKIKAIFQTHEGYREEIILEQGQEVLIAPHIRHAFLALEDCIVLEFRISWYDKNSSDTHPVTMDISGEGGGK